MKKTIVLFIFLFHSNVNFSQSKYIELPTIGLTGYVFDESYELRFNISEMDGRFTPNDEDIRVSEELLSYFDVSNRKGSKKLKRQYLGFLKKGSKYILVHAMCYKSDKKFNSDFPNWSKDFSVILDGNEKDQKSFLYIVDVTGKLIGFY